MKKMLLCALITGCGIDGSKLCIVDGCIWENIFNGSNSSTISDVECTYVIENGVLTQNLNSGYDTGTPSTQSCNGNECIPAEWCADGYCDSSLNCSAYQYDCGDC